MTAPNRNTLWGTALVDELARAGVDAVVASPGSRSTPLTLAAARNDDVRVLSALDERSAAFFALGRARRTGEVTPLICTSGTATANYHPAVMEADQGRVPLLLLTADRPPELRDSGANQTADQTKLYGDAVRYEADLPEPEADARKLRSLRTTVARALGAAEGADAGPVHLNVPFRKPLEPTPVAGDVPADLDRAAAEGRDGPFVGLHHGVPELDDGRLRDLAEALSADHGLIVAGPADPPGLDPEAVTALSHATGYPILADPLSGLRYGGHTRVAPVIGHYDAYLDASVAGDGSAVDGDGSAADGDGPVGSGTGADDGVVDADSPLGPVWDDPEVVLRLGASPTSKNLRKYLAATGARQFVVDPAGRWREAEFRATDLVVAEPSRLCGRLSRLVAGSSSGAWRGQWTTADDAAGEVLDVAGGQADAADDSHDATGSEFPDESGVPEGYVVAAVTDRLPDPATLFVSNSMPVRDLDRFVGPSTGAITALGNRGVSGIDGVVSSALGAGSATTDDLTLVVGDIAFYHDMNGLLALERCDVDATVVLINNDGGGIFHELPVESYEPAFTEQFKTPHGLDFEPTGQLYDLDFRRVDLRDCDPADAVAAVGEAYDDARRRDGSTVLEARIDAADSHRARSTVRDRVLERVDDAL